MVYQIAYTDFDEVDTLIQWYRFDDPFTDFYDFCAGDSPLIFKWWGNRYDGVRGSDILIRVVIQNDTDKKELDKTLNGGFYITISKAGTPYWYGQMFPQLFTEPHEPYSYTIELNGADHLGRMKEYRFKMVDFPDPYIPTAPTYTLLDIFNKALTDPTVIPTVATNACAPSVINISSRLYHTTGVQWQTFEDTYLDPRAFMESDKDAYIDKLDMLNRILKVMYMKLFQWEGQWWLMSIDTPWNAGEITYRQYTLDYTLGWTFISQNTINPPIIETCDAGELRTIRGTSTMEYIANWQGVYIDQSFEQNLNVLPAFANRTGNFYTGEDPIFLEILPITYADRLQHWSSAFGGVVVDTYPEENSGNLSVSDHPGGYSRINYLDIVMDNPDQYNRITFSFNYDAPDSLTTFVRFSIQFTRGGTNRWLHYKNRWNEDLEWTNTADTLDILIESKDLPYEYSIVVPRPLDEKTDTTAQLHFELYKITQERKEWEPNPTTTEGIFNSMRIGFLSPGWEAIKYNSESQAIFDPDSINPLGAQAPPAFEYKWGLHHNDLPNDWEIHLSAPYDSTGEVIGVNWAKDGKPVTTVQSLIAWMQKSFHDDNFDRTSILKTSHRTTTLTPLNIIRDHPSERVNVTLASYSYVTPATGAAPASGEIMHTDALLNTLQIHKTDNNGIDRSFMLSTLRVNDSIAVGATTWTVISSVDAGTHYDVVIAPALQHTPDGIDVFTFSVNGFVSNYFTFLNGELDDRKRIWKSEYEQAKWIENVPDIVIKGDFSPIEFNNDFDF